MLELTTINTTELTNKKLGTQLNNIKKGGRHWQQSAMENCRCRGCRV